MSAGGLAVAVGPEREREARAAIVAAFADKRLPGGGYRLENEWHCLVARAP